MERKNRDEANLTPEQALYKTIIQTYRDKLTDDEMEIFLALYESGDKSLAAADLMLPLETIEDLINIYRPHPVKRAAKTERLTNDGQPYLRRLSQTALLAILNDVSELDDGERKIIAAMIGKSNQTVAALSIGMSYKDFIKQYIAIRKKHGF